MNYHAALQFLHESVNYETLTQYSCADAFDLARIREVLKRLGNPDTAYRSIIVAGTNGKGSVTHMSARMLAAHGYSVGVFTSPHITDVRERISINNTLISKRDFVRAVRVIHTWVPQEYLVRLTYFERLTVIALWYFADQNVDWAFLEVGMGGRLDATNVVDAAFAVITPISRDHEDKLGNTLVKIAREKAGVIARNATVIVAKQEPGVLRVIQSVAKRQQARCLLVSTRKSLPRTVRQCLPKMYADNMRTAIRLLEALTTYAYIPLSVNKMAAVLQRWCMPGRFETVARQPKIIVDGAHNEAGVYATLSAFRKIHTKKRCVLLVSLVSDKAVARVARVIESFGMPLVVTRNTSPRSLEAETFAGHFSSETKIVAVADNCATALASACDYVGRRGVVLCLGSFYLVSDVKRCISKSGFEKRLMARL